jgi:uncharacterized protein YbjT (DUF2867 family)
MIRTVLVFGGTGALGAPVARQLRNDGYQVRLLVRDLVVIDDQESLCQTVESGSR